MFIHLPHEIGSSMININHIVTMDYDERTETFDLYMIDNFRYVLTKAQGIRLYNKLTDANPFKNNVRDFKQEQ